MFNAFLQPKPATSWQEHSLLEDGAVQDTGFQAMDWDALPRVDYHAAQFRQLAVAEPVKVLDQPDQFVVDNYQEPAKVKSEPTTEQAPVVESEHNTDLMGLSSPSVDKHEEFAEMLTPESTTLSDESESELSAVPEFEPGTESDVSDNEQAMNSEAWQQACEEAYQQGLQEGMAQAQLQAQSDLEAALAQAQAKSQVELKKSLDTQKKSLEQRLHGEVDLLREVTQRLEALTENSSQFFEPLKRLAVHIAEQLVLAELNVSGSAIERLVQRCLDELNLHGTQIISVELNPQDKSRLEDMSGDLLKQIQLLPVPGLQPGSVRVIVNDTQVEDLVQHRLEALAHALLGQPEAWREKSPFFKQPLAHRESDVQDAVQSLALPDPGDEDVLDA